MAQPHLVVEHLAAGHHTSAGAGAFLPVVHVVPLEGARGSEPVGGDRGDGLIHLRGSGEVGKAQAQISMLSGPLGCQVRKEWELIFITEQLGNTVRTMGFSIRARGRTHGLSHWIPAFTGMTVLECRGGRDSFLV